LYVSETWTIKARDARRITAAEMKYMRRTAGYIWTDYKTNTFCKVIKNKHQFWTNYWNTRENGYNV
jgi:ABC-type ATPase involved in cell division